MSLIHARKALRNIVAKLRNYRAEMEIKKSHPTCAIDSGLIRDSSLGKYAAVLAGAQLQGVSIGDCSYVSFNSRLVNVSMGRFCSIGPEVQIGLAPHPSRTFVSTYPAFYSDSNDGCPRRFRNGRTFDDTVPRTTVGSDVWIGANVIIPGGIGIGHGAIIAAGSVVVKDVMPYAVVGGNPAGLIKYRFTEAQIATLLDISWWDWPLEAIERKIDQFANVEALIQAQTGGANRI